jgi:hypothetical protein
VIVGKALPFTSSTPVKFVLGIAPVRTSRNSGSPTFSGIVRPSTSGTPGVEVSAAPAKYVAPAWPKASSVMFITSPTRAPVGVGAMT